MNDKVLGNAAQREVAYKEAATQRRIDAALENARKPYQEYIKFLEDAVKRGESFLLTHGLKCSKEDFEKGKRLRADIKQGEDNVD